MTSSGSGTGPVGAAPGPTRVLVVTVVHDPEDARIRHRELVSLLQAGVQVTYAAPFSAYGRSVPDGVRGIDLPRARGRHRLAAVRAARAVVRAEAGRQDAVLVHDPELLLALAGLRGRAGAPAPARIWDVHEDTAAALGMRSWMPGWARPAAAGAVRLLERWADRRLHLLLAEDGYRERFARPHPVVPNTVFVPGREPDPPGRDRVVYLGRLTVPRGALDLVEVGRLLAGRVRADLVGPADPDCAEQVALGHRQGWVHHHGFVPNDRALGLLEGAAAGLSLLHDEPNYAHSRPTKAMEYMAYGVPVVTTPNLASVELVDRVGCGLVVPFGDPPAAADAVLRLVDDEALRARLSKAGREVAVVELDWRRQGRVFAEQVCRWAAERHD